MMNVHLKNVITAAFPPCVTKRLMPGLPLPRLVSNHAWGVYGQMGEDLVTDALLGLKQRGFYIDVGANDPMFLSNTKRFYDRGWRGINLEPDPVKYAQLVKARPRDVNLNLGAGPVDGEMTFHRFAIDTINTFDPKQAKAAALESKLLEKKPVPVKRLSAIIDAHAASEHIDFLSVDVEGFELSVLEGMDWTRHRPDLVVMEINIEGEGKVSAMYKHGYDLVFSNGLNGFFMEEMA